MFVKTITFVFVCSILGWSEAGIVDTIKKCSVKDEECLRTSIGDAFKRIGEAGIPELDIPIFDPFEFEDQSISLPNFGNLKLYDGRVIGIKDCNVDKAVVNLDKGMAMIEFTCDLLIMESKYQFAASSPIFLSILGSESIHGEGNGKVELEKLHLKVNTPISIQKREDELYLIYDRNHVAYEYEVLGKATMFADNIYIGEQESSKSAVKLFNDNWKLVVNTFGNLIVGRAMKISFDMFFKFYNFVPATHYLIDELSPYVK